MSIQRRRGQKLIIFPSRESVDARGNPTFGPDLSAGIETTAVAIPQRSARAEVPGQVEIDVTRLLVRADLPGVTLWSRVLWDGSMWDVVAPPSLHGGTRHVRHLSIDVRRRPDG